MTTLDDLARIIWMTWYKTMWPWQWMELNLHPWPVAMSENWKTFVILR